MYMYVTSEGPSYEEHGKALRLADMSVCVVAIHSIPLIAEDTDAVQTPDSVNTDSA